MDHFIYYGHFYRLRVGDVEHRCRSTLEIVRSHSEECVTALAEDSGPLLDHQPDAVFVMLNPGASRPADGQERDDVIDPCTIQGDARDHLVATCPDDTQLAIERVMSCKGFDHVRVINMFDIRDTDSRSLAKLVRDLHSGTNGLPDVPEMKSCSIFSSERRRELRCRLNVRNPVIVAAWTTSRDLIPFFKKCYGVLEELDGRLQIHGWQPPDERLYYHPSRKKNKWAEHIVQNWPRPSWISRLIRAALRRRSPIAAAVSFVRTRWRS